MYSLYSRLQIQQIRPYILIPYYNILYYFMPHSNLQYYSVSYHTRIYRTVSYIHAHIIHIYMYNIRFPKLNVALGWLPADGTVACYCGMWRPPGCFYKLGGVFFKGAQGCLKGFEVDLRQLLELMLTRTAWLFLRIGGPFCVYVRAP